MFQASAHFFSRWRTLRFTSVFFYLIIAAVTPYLFDAQAQSANNSNNQNTVQVIDVRVAHSSDDAEEQLIDGLVSVASDDLEMVHNINRGNQIIGIRFDNVKIPEGAYIRSAYLQFKSKKRSIQPTSLKISMEAANHASTFTQVRTNISGRELLPISVYWPVVENWLYPDTFYRSPDVSTLVQKVVNRGGWRIGNAMAFIIHGYGLRSAYANDAGATKAPILHVEYQIISLSAHTISASAGNYGAISPEGEVKVLHNKNETFTITPDKNCHIVDVLVDGKSVGAVADYTFKFVTENHTIAAEFAPNPYTVTAKAGNNGSISPAGAQNVKPGEDLKFTMIPDEGYHVKDVLVDQKSVGPVDSYTFTNISADHAISAEFALNRYTLKADASANGTIDPQGEVVVDHGGSKTFTIKANDHYEIGGVKVDDKYKGAISTYTFENVTQNHTIHATFTPKFYLISVKDVENGKVTPAQMQMASFGDSITYTFTPDDGYRLSDIIIDNQSVGANLSYTLTVTSSHVIEAVFVKKNQPPVADAGPDQTVEEGATVLLSAENSIDPDDGIASFLWKQIAGPEVSLSDKTGEAVKFTASDMQGQSAALVFQVTVTDYAGLTSQDTSIVNVTWDNIPPKAVCGPDQTVAGGVKVVLDGASSFDPDDGIQTYHWVQKSGPQVDLFNRESVRAHFIAPEDDAEMALVFQLTVTDREGLMASAETVVNVSADNTGLTAEAGPTQIVKEGELVTLNGSNSFVTDSSITSYTWTQVTGEPVVLSDSSSIITSFVAPNVGTEGAALTFKLMVTDKNGLKSQDTCIVNVMKDNLPPIADAGSDITVQSADRVILDGGRSFDQDGGIFSYQWRQVSGPLVILSGAGSTTPIFTVPEVAGSDHSLIFRLTVTDTGGLESYDDVIVNVANKNLPPVAHAGGDQVIKSGRQVVLNASRSSDPDGEIVSYQWVQVSGPPVTLNTPNVMIPSFVAPVVTLYNEILVFELIVTDDGAIKNSDTCQVKIEAAGSSQDSTAPEVRIKTPVDGGLYETVDTRLSISGTARDENGVAVVTWTNSNGDEGVAKGTSEWSISSISLSMGRNVITIIATDKSGNSSSTQIVVVRKEKPDKEKPVIVISYPNTMGYYETDLAYIQIKGTSRDNDQVKVVTWKNSNGDKGEAVGTGNWQINNLKLDYLINDISVTATDMAGNSSTANITIVRWPFTIF